MKRSDKQSQDADLIFKAVVMAGGEGTRLRPLTCNVPKPMMSIFDKPVMAHGLELLKKYGIKDVAVTLQYLPGAVKGFFGDGRDYDLNIRYFVEDSPLGTAGSVKNAHKFLDKTFIVISGDALTDFPLDQAMEFHRSRGALATLILARVELPLEYGLVLTDGEGRITRFLEKPSWGEVFSDTVNTGIYILEPEALDWVKSGTRFDFSRDLFPQFLAQKKALYGCVLPGYWCDIGNHQQYRQVHNDILNGLVNVEVEGERRGSMIISPKAHVASGVRLEGPIYIGADCDVASGARLLPYSVLGQGSLVEAGASLKRTITGQGCVIGSGSEIRGAILGRGVRTKNRVQIFEGVIGDDSVLEEEVVIKPEVKVWPQKVVEAGRILAQSLVWSEKVPRSIFSRRGVVGSINGDLTPEKMVRLGRALGTILPVNTKVVVGCDWSQGAWVAKQALESGLMASGLTILDAGRTLTSALRFSTRELEASRGFYLAMDRDNSSLALLIVDQDGINLIKSEERKIENIWSRQEYRPIKADRIGTSAFIPDISSAYMANILQDIDIDAMARKRFRVVVASNEPRVGEWVADLLDRIQCDVIRMDCGENNKRSCSKEDLEFLVHETADWDGDLGIYLEEFGEAIALVSPSGQVVQDETLLALISSFFAEGFGDVYLPADVPLTIERFVQQMGKKVVRTRVALGDFMQELVNGKEWNQLRLYTEGMYFVVRLLELMAHLDRDLDDLLDSLPPFFYDKSELAISWEQKGRIIRRLAEDAEGGSDQELEGIRLWGDSGSSLILPDEDRPVCLIYSESFSQETAESLTEFCMETIKNICQEEE
ncbi:MAG: nucleotidyltransferase [Syntrophomonadaceae bacterium]|nr:nucleotidyltransferase [Syntrophomonadaceae bacterium]